MSVLVRIQLCEIVFTETDMICYHVEWLLGTYSSYI